MLKKIIFLMVCNSILLLSVSCGIGGKDSFDKSRKLGTTTHEVDGTTIETVREELKVADKDAGSYDKGLFLTVKNSLATHKPKLSVELCSPMKNNKEFCLVNKKTIKFDESENYYIAFDDLKKLIGDSKNISWRFNETYSNSFMHWRCYENPGMKINVDKLNKAEVKVTQINTGSYSCVVK